MAPRVAGLIKDSAEEAGHTLADAFTGALSASNRGEIARKSWTQSVEKFLQWLNRNHPAIVEWKLLSRTMIREYLQTFDGLSATTRRLAVQPIIQTDGFMSREFGYKRIAERLGTGSKLKNTPAQVYLADVLDFCDWLAARLPHLEAGAALQGLAGLQLQEASRLTWNRVELEQGLIEISGEVKNEYRNRVIPVCSRVLEALERAFQRQGEQNVQGIADPVILTLKGAPYVFWQSYSKEITQALRQWNPKIGWKPKDLRNCLPTFAVSQGVHGTVWEQYIGHAPRTVTERHYIPRIGSVSKGEREALDQQMDLFRKFVVDPVERKIATKLQLFDERAKVVKIVEL